jgi:DNA mismatch repair protein MutS
MEYPKEVLVKDYFEIHDYYSNIYGKGRTIILMQVGSFHEAYSTIDDNTGLGLDLVDLAQQLDVCCTKKNSNLPLSRSNPRMMGFPIFVTNNFIDKLIDLNYTIVLIDQISEPPNPKRQVTGIYSPATHIEKKNVKSTYLMAIVLDKIKESKTNLLQIYIGLSVYDLTTGEGAVYETHSKSNDNLIGLDDAIRFMENFPPREIILENNIKDDDLISSMKVDDILSYLNIDKTTTYSIKITSHKKIAFQKNLFEKIYKIESNVDLLEIMGLQFLNLARFSLTLLLEYAMNHQPRLLENLKIPIIFTSEKYLYLGNRALEQLNVTTSSNGQTGLFNIINFTKTILGKRYLSAQLTMPLVDAIELNQRYEAINKLLEGNHSSNLVNYLEDIYDLDKLIRKLEINIISPYELYQIYLSFYQVNKLTDYFKTNKLLKTFNINKKLIKSSKRVIEWIESKFVLSSINGLNFNNFTESELSFYTKSTHAELDLLQDKINSIQNFMSLLVGSLETHVQDKVFFKKTNNTETQTLINLKFNDRDGHYLLITNRRCEILKKNLSTITKLQVGSIELDVNDLEFAPLPKSSNTKINCKKIKELSLDLITYKIAMGKKLKELFKIDMKEFLELFGNNLHLWSNKLAYVDFINSGALAALTNHYSKPIINQKVASYFKATELRHPIIEKISTDTTFIPHDIELGYETNQDGILLYGINSSGKSTLMKSIGLNIIMAQIGYYTATSSFEYSPYTSLFTRISGNDNMFRGLSSFMVEMMEIMAILKRNNSKALIIGDEIARGTETRSASIIVCYILETLAKSNTSFITATHLHDITTLKSIKKLERVKAKHLKITYDASNDLLIYDRHLSDGQGESFYGLQVAKYLMKDKNFNDRTTELLQEYDNVSSDKQSKYNTNVFLNCCEICKSHHKLETHHIIWQKEFNSNNINPNKLYLQKNDSSNLVVLCMSCHDKVDSNDIIVNGWIDTSNGRKFDYEIITETKPIKSKYNDELINYIKELKIMNDEKLARIKIKEKFDKKISINTIKIFWAK